MLNGLYSSATAMDVATKRHETIANNLANLNSPGFKRTLMANEVRALGGAYGWGNQDIIGTRSDTTHVDYSQGSIRDTGRDLDVAIHGDGFFSIETPQGNLYTRNGSFQVSETGELVTIDGLRVLGTAGPIQIPNEVSISQVSIARDGSVFADEQPIGQLDIVMFDDVSRLEQVGTTRFRAPVALGVQQADNVVVQQGALETSNAVSITEMIRMMTGMRHFEAAQQTLRAISEAIQQYTTMDS